MRRKRRLWTETNEGLCWERGLPNGKREVSPLQIDMKPVVELQACDIRILRVLEKKQSTPLKIKAIEEDLAKIEEGMKEVRAGLESQKEKRREMDREVDELEEKIRKSNIKLDNIKSNKEYRAALKELDDLKREKSLMEDAVLEVMEEVEAMEDRISSDKVRWEQARKKYEENLEEIREQMKELDRDLESLQEERSKLIKEVDADLLKTYDFLREKRGGLAVTPVMKGVCTGCNIGLPPQRFNELRRGDEVMTCPNCRRIIYWGEDERFQNQGEENTPMPE